MSNQIPTNMIQRDSFNPMGGATNSGGLTLSDYKLRMLRPDVFGVVESIKRIAGKFTGGFGAKEMIEAILQNGDAQPAIVISLKPLLVSAYSDEFDGVVLLDVPESLTEIYQLRLGTRLLTCCFYGQDNRMQGDIITGPQFSKRWQIFMPLIADFVSADYPRIRQLKQKFDEDSWHKAWYMGLTYRQQRPGWVRFGLPGLSMVEAEKPAPGTNLNRSIYDRL